MIDEAIAEVLNGEIEITEPILRHSFDLHIDG